MKARDAAAYFLPHVHGAHQRGRRGAGEAVRVERSLHCQARSQAKLERAHLNHDLSPVGKLESDDL